MSVIIRAATASDMDAIAHIYAHHVNHGTGTFETDPPDSSEIGRRWAEVTARGLPWLVADDDGDVVGYAYAGPYRPRVAYGRTVQVRALAGYGLHATQPSLGKERRLQAFRIAKIA